MSKCKCCSNYFRNTKKRITDSCLGEKDLNKNRFICNQDLEADFLQGVDTQDLITELEKRGFVVSTIKNSKE